MRPAFHMAACVGIAIIPLAGCDRVYPNMHFASPEETVFGIDSCNQVNMDCTQGIDTTRIRSRIEYFAPDGFAYSWFDDSIRKSRWIAKRWNGRDCFFLVGAFYECNDISPKDAATSHDVIEGDVFSLKERYESGKRRLPDFADVRSGKPLFVSRTDHIKTQLRKWDETAQVGGQQ